MTKFLVKKLHLDLYMSGKKNKNSQQNHDKNLLAKANCEGKIIFKRL